MAIEERKRPRANWRRNRSRLIGFKAAEWTAIIKGQLDQTRGPERQGDGAHVYGPDWSCLGRTRGRPQQDRSRTGAEPEWEISASHPVKLARFLLSLPPKVSGGVSVYAVSGPHNSIHDLPLCCFLKASRQNPIMTSLLLHACTHR